MDSTQVAEKATDKAATGKAGRNLRAAFASGITLATLILGSLLLHRPSFVGIVSFFACLGSWEILRAMRQAGYSPTQVIVLAATAVIPPVAYVWGPNALFIAVAGAFLALLLWTALESNSAVDTGMSVFVLVYVPTMLAFAMMLLAQDNGAAKLFMVVLLPVCSDVGGYTAGVFFGKNPMAPTVSPKKSWEGFAGSAIATTTAGTLAVMYFLDGSWWVGTILGALIVVAATLGDLCESMIKRDLGIKDMSNLIPGHGGVMDRLDSILVAAPVTWAVLTVLL